MKVGRSLAVLSVFILLASYAKAGNPIVRGFGMADPHGYVFEDRLYLFTTRDADSTAHRFVMSDWHIWSSEDMIEWRHERTISPAETYMGESNNCWATETAYNNGKYYFYFSNGNVNSGVMVADCPAGPYKDVLGRPMMDVDLTSTKEYDSSVLVEEDGSAYIIFGHFVTDDPNLQYYMARLNPDMTSLAERPRRVEIVGKMAGVLGANDKPNIHKYNGVYYLSAGTHYATSDNIYGPYTRRGNSGNEKMGLGGRAHGNYFKWNNQWFNTWCHFFKGKEVCYFRESYITYLHYRANGEMVSDTLLLESHFESGVGQYSADWESIEAEWFMRASKDGLKRETSTGGFAVSPAESGDYIYFPNIAAMDDKRGVELSVKIEGRGVIELREGAVDGELIGLCRLKKESEGFEPKRFKISPKGSKSNIYMVFKGVDGRLCQIDSFRFL